MQIEGQQIAVTGALGRAGRHIVHALNAAGAKTVNIDAVPSSNPFFEPSRIADLTRYGDVVANLVGCAAVVHFGANPWPDLDFFAGADRFANNTVGTFNVFQAAAQLGIPRVVWASSETVQGFPYDRVSPVRIPISEEDAPMPQCAYALSKVTCERLAHDMATLHGTSFAALRLAHVLYAEDGDYEMFRELWNDPTPRRNLLWKYVDIRDVVSVTLAALTADFTGAQVFNVAAADIAVPVPVRDLFAKEFPNTKVAPDMGVYQTPVDLSKAQKILGWAPKVSWRDVLDDPS